MRPARGAVAMLLACIASASTGARADAPAVMPMQGYLTDDAGAPIDGPTSMRFAIYTVDVGGTPIWSEDQTVAVEAGYFTAYLGDVAPIDLAVFRDEGALFVGIRIGAGSELAPRAQLGSVPYAAFAQYAAAVPFGGIVGAPAHVTTGYTGEGGVSVAGTTIRVDATAVQSRVVGACAAGEAIRAIDEAGAVTCELTSYTAGAGLTLMGRVFSIADGAITSSMLAEDSATMSAVALPGANVSGTYSATLVAGTNYIMSGTSVTPDDDGWCFVVASVHVRSLDATDTGTANVRTARATGAAAPTTDGRSSAYAIGVGASVSTNAVQPYVWTVAAGTTYTFGCYVSAPADFVGEVAYCNLSYFCSGS